MRIILKSEKAIEPVKFIRRCGYGLIYDRRSGKTSFIKRLSPNFYPRFHLYVNQVDENKIVLNLHLDQKKIKLNDKIIHAGDYESDLLRQEAERIKKYFESFDH